MKLSLFAAALLGILSFHGRAAVGPIHLDVEQHSGTKPANAKSGTAVTVTKPGQQTKSNLMQHRSLTIKLSNNSAEPFDRLMVKYFFLGHDMKDHNVTVLKQGERKSSIPPRGSDTVESEDATSTYTEAHTEVTKARGKGGKSKPGSKKIPASGKKFTGYAVQILNGSKIEAEYYSEPSYKAKVQAAAPSLADQPAKANPSKKSAPKKKK